MNRFHPALVSLLLVSCVSVAPFQGLVTESPDFRVEAAPGSSKRGPTVEGYVYNKRLMLATSVRLRIEALDAAGAVVGTTIQPLDRDVPIGDRSYFEQRAPAGAAYRVAVDYVFWVIPSGL